MKVILCNTQRDWLKKEIDKKFGSCNAFCQEIQDIFKHPYKTTLNTLRRVLYKKTQKSIEDYILIKALCILNVWSDDFNKIGQKPSVYSSNLNEHYYIYTHENAEIPIFEKGELSICIWTEWEKNVGSHILSSILNYKDIQFFTDAVSSWTQDRYIKKRAPLTIFMKNRIKIISYEYFSEEEEIPLFIEAARLSATDKTIVGSITIYNENIQRNYFLGFKTKQKDTMVEAMFKKVFGDIHSINTPCYCKRFGRL